MAAPPTKLCVFCRRLEPISQPCASLPTSRAVEFNAPIGAHEGELIARLQQQPSTLCQRCAVFDIVRVFEDSNPVDRTERSNLTKEQMFDYLRSSAKHEMQFGELASLILSPSCPLCRLIFRIFPREGLGSTDVMLRLMPFRSYYQQRGWNTFSPQLKSNPAVFLGVSQVSDVIINEREPPSFVRYREGHRTGESIALAGAKRSGNARCLEPFVDISVFSKALEDCISHHGPDCQATASSELSLTRMIDVVDRKVVPCPEQCDYFALSYVWGGVMPAPNALETKTLPNTIEDAITVTRKFGRRYLWVDALCIDQDPNPTPLQRAEKEQQLKMMDQIYSSATLTLVAVAGDNSNAGFPGVAVSRPHQVLESIDDHTFFVVPPTAMTEVQASTWSTRAWTLQESLLCRRYLYFTATQVEFTCFEHRVPETLEATGEVPSWERPSSSSPLFGQWNDGMPDDTLKFNFWTLIANYTERRMTHDVDSLNAILGIISLVERMQPAAACVWGLPLALSPQTLGWMHIFEVGEPRRREAFPSWSWAGWEGEVTISDKLLLAEGWNDIGYKDVSRDMAIRYVGVNGIRIEIEGWQVSLEIRTEPFSEALLPGTQDMMGYVRERNFPHPITIPTGIYECLVVERFAFRKSKDGPVYNMAFLIVLEPGAGPGVYKRKTLITVTTLASVDFMCLKPVRKTVVME
ncbi:heterokaryon incompatibility protein-domain-containing protein [Triangularia verruculosa]|uniref:Heterokaryon incompatibility protein-domain-containing protein n=1 Tax=Triangularia verruculosa TaxID=2587418 RepID=A0AAN6X9S9_9PEZI|nr:heterokaryon incompatibility protein-domain-containing protein [Triangularia verruculosa]